MNRLALSLVIIVGGHSVGYLIQVATRSTGAGIQRRVLVSTGAIGPGFALNLSGLGRPIAFAF